MFDFNYSNINFLLFNRIDNVANSVGRIDDVFVQMGLASASVSENLESVIDRLRRVND
jgi:hypothetical protein